MDVTWTVKYITEFLGTAILIMLGNGAVANTSLKGTFGQKTGTLLVAFGFGLGLMLPAMMFGNVSGNHINPAVTLGLAVSGLFPWAQVAPYMLAQLLGAIFGQLVLVAIYSPYYKNTMDAASILGTFATTSALDNGTEESRKPALINGFVNEFFATFIFVFGIKALTGNYFGSELLTKTISEAKAQGMTVTSEQIEMLRANLVQATNGSLTVAHMALGFLLMAMVVAFGGATGPSVNPARDLGPRLVHHFLPAKVLGEAKGDSKWWYAWVPVVAPFIAAIAAVALYQFLYA